MENTVVKKMAQVLVDVADTNQQILAKVEDMVKRIEALEAAANAKK